MKRTIKIILLCCLSIIIIIGLYKTLPSKTVDFHGAVTKIETKNNNTIFNISANYASYIVVANNKTKVTYCCKDDPTIELSDIKIGDTISGNYRYFSKNNTAKIITVEYHNTEFS